MCANDIPYYLFFCCGLGIIIRFSYNSFLKNLIVLPSILNSSFLRDSGYIARFRLHSADIEIVTY